MTKANVIYTVFFGAVTFGFVWGFIVFNKGSRRAAVAAGLVTAIILMALDVYVRFHPHAR